MTLDVENTTRRGEDKAPSSLGNNRGTLVPPALNQHIKNFALGIDAASQIDIAAIDFEIDLDQMPGRVGHASAFAQVRCDHRPEMVHPAPDTRRKPRFCVLPANPLAC